MTIETPKPILRMDALRTIIDFHAGEAFDGDPPFHIEAFDGLRKDAETAGPNGYVLIVTAEQRDTLVYALRNTAHDAREARPEPGVNSSSLTTRIAVVEGVNALLTQLGADPETLPTDAPIDLNRFIDYLRQSGVTAEAVIEALKAIAPPIGIKGDYWYPRG